MRVERERRERVRGKKGSESREREGVRVGREIDVREWGERKGVRVGRERVERERERE